MLSYTWQLPPLDMPAMILDQRVPVGGVIIQKIAEQTKNVKIAQIVKNCQC
jgi:hypothetical protein